MRLSPRIVHSLHFEVLLAALSVGYWFNEQGKVMRKKLLAAVVTGALFGLQGCGEEPESGKVGVSALSLTEKDVVVAVGAPVLKRVVKRAGECAISRYKFSRDVVGMTLEFNCGRTNISWHKAEGGSTAQAQVGENLARRALAALTGTGGGEVDAALMGEIFRSKSLAQGLKLSGSCKSSVCLLTVSGAVARDPQVTKAGN
ncbi:hypothetical protein [Pseudomonas sp. Q1-7]|uniref:hypothetical protein n=1 Tax=Pseudomonas sp. Q1-7 TaxID=3020843 RepID=UPI0022FFF15C|nr:hypothetical protein [Pseudomonas sp. Q1-7]